MTQEVFNYYATVAIVTIPVVIIVVSVSLVFFLLRPRKDEADIFTYDDKKEE